jgi:uncharacterized phage-like protein YoqJ
MLVLFLVRNSQLMINIKTCQNLVDKALILLLSFNKEWELEKGNLGLEVWLLNCKLVPKSDDYLSQIPKGQ